MWPEERNGRGERGRAKRLFSSPILPQRKGEESWGRERERSQFWIFLCRKWGGDEEGPFLLWPLSPFLREKGNFLSSSPSPSSLSFSNPTTSSSSFLPPPPALQIDSFNIRLRRCLGKLSPSSPRKIRQTLPYLSIETLTLTLFLGQVLRIYGTLANSSIPASPQVRRRRFKREEGIFRCIFNHLQCENKIAEKYSCHICQGKCFLCKQKMGELLSFPLSSFFSFYPKFPKRSESYPRPPPPTFPLLSLGLSLTHAMEMGKNWRERRGGRGKFGWSTSLPPAGSILPLQVLLAIQPTTETTLK